MNPLKNNTANKLNIADLYPDLTFEQQEEAEHFLTRYVDLVRQIFERRVSTRNEPDGVDLTENREAPNMLMN
jgi:hypothetical protein